MDGFSLRPATEEDLGSVVAIENATHLAPWNEDGFRREIDKSFSNFWVYTDDETDSIIAGYIVFWILDQECRIQNVVVSLSHRGLGFGQLLVRAAIKEALAGGALKAALEVRKSNEAALQLYQKIGFSIVQVRKGFYSNGEDAYVMELGLDGPRVENLA